MEFIKQNKKIIVSGLVFVFLLIASIANYVISDIKDTNVYAESEECICDIDNTLDAQEEFYVDIKGAVKKPGVYLANNKNIVKDIIDLAGGLKSNATTKNINLSQKVTSEMVIYICTKSELQSATTTVPTTSTSTTVKDTSSTTSTSNSCTNYPNSIDSSTTGEQSTLVNINTASKEELMTIPQIGSSKADSIIIYRTENKFTKIEDIINVTGIGEALFAKIKDYITV